MSKRKEKQRKNRSVAQSTRRRFQKKYLQYKSGKASNNIVHFKKLLNSIRFLKIVLYCRVSRCWQKKNGNLNDQEKYLRRKIRKYEKKYKVKIDIVAVFNEVASGGKNDRKWLIAAADTAKKLGVVLLAESTCRFIRNKDYHSSLNPDILPTIDEYEALVSATKGVTLATIMHPNATWKKVKAYHTKRGQRSKNKRGGRPKVNKSGYKKKRRLEELPIVLRLRKKGVSWGKIFALTKIPKTTSADWVKKYRK